MARDNEETDTLELHIKVNGQNLSTISDKYNISTLRVPSDPSWPKIPQRRSNNNTDDIIEPPCVVTLTGSPRKSRSIVQTVAYQQLKSKASQKYETTSHIPKRLPSSFDPRFRRQILRQKAEKPDELCNRKNDKQIPESDILHIPREVEKELEDESLKMDKRIDNYISPFYDVNNLSSNGVGRSTNIVDKQSILEAKHPSNNCVEQYHHQSISGHCHDKVWVKEKEKIDSNVSLKQAVANKITLVTKDHYGKLDALDNNTKDANDCGSLNFNTITKLKGFIDQSCTKDCSSIVDGCNGRKISNEKITKTWMPSYINEAPKENTHFTYCVEKCRGRVENNNVQNFASSSDNKCSKDDIEEKKKDERKRNGERFINVKHKTVTPINLPRKVKSFFRKKSCLAIADSDCTLILPGYRYVKNNRYKKMKNFDRSQLSSLSSFPQRNGINNMNSILAKCNMSKQGRINYRLLTNRQTKKFHNLSSISLETRELLNKSYWEYYWKLKRKVAGKSVNSNNSVGKRDNLPESQTLRQCSVLSCMINQVLEQDSNSAIPKERSFSDPAVNVTSNAHECVHQVSDFSSEFVNKIKRKRIKRASKRLLGLRAVAMLCVALYVTIIFLSMMYAEEYDDENTNYVELIFLYITSSFEEALDGINNILSTIRLPIKFDRQ